MMDEEQFKELLKALGIKNKKDNNMGRRDDPRECLRKMIISMTQEGRYGG